MLVKGGMEGEEHLLATLEMEASKHEEELLAEALLLQEELGVDLADHVWAFIYIFFFYFISNYSLGFLFLLSYLILYTVCTSRSRAHSIGTVNIW